MSLGPLACLQNAFIEKRDDGITTITGGQIESLVSCPIVVLPYGIVIEAHDIYHIGVLVCPLEIRPLRPADELEVIEELEVAL